MDIFPYYTSTNILFAVKILNVHILSNCTTGKWTYETTSKLISFDSCKGIQQIQITYKIQNVVKVKVKVRIFIKLLFVEQPRLHWVC